MLHAQGTTPEEADAKALKGGTLRAERGGDVFDRMGQRLAPGAAAEAAMPETIRAANAAKGASPVMATMAENVMAKPAASAFVGPEPRVQTFAERAASHGDGRYGLPPNPTPGVTSGAAIVDKIEAGLTEGKPDNRSALRRGMDGASSAAKSAAGFAKSVAPAIGAGIAGSGAAQLARGIGAPTGDSVASGTVVAGSQAAAGIPTGGDGVAPKAQPYNFFTDNEAGRNIGNAVSAVSTIPLGRALRAGTALQASEAAVQGAAANIRSGREGGVPTPAPTAQTDAQRGGADTTPVALPPAVDPNSLRRIDGGSSPLFTNRPDGGFEGNDALMGRRPTSAQNQRAMDGIQARQDAGDQARANKAKFDQEVADANFTNASQGFGTGTPMSLRSRLEAQMSRGKMTRRGAEVVQNLAATDERAETARAQNRTTLRGQDMELEGKMVPVRAAAARQRLLQGVMAESTDKDGNVDFNRAANRAASLGLKEADDIRKNVSDVQGQAAASQTLKAGQRTEARKLFDGAFSERADVPADIRKSMQDNAYATFEANNPNFASYGPKERASALADARGQEQFMANFRAPKQGGAGLIPDVLIPGKGVPAGGETVPDADFWKGASISDRVGGLRGALSPITEKGDYFLSTPDGRDINLKGMSREGVTWVKKQIENAQRK